jgi:hypothetical protein
MARIVSNPTGFMVDSPQLWGSKVRRSKENLQKLAHR